MVEGVLLQTYAFCHAKEKGYKSLCYSKKEIKIFHISSILFYLIIRFGIKGVTMCNCFYIIYSGTIFYVLLLVNNCYALQSIFLNVYVTHYIFLTCLILC